ncbi:hypothetical protein [Bizionia myxarmorum]|uniref:Uncharacterized protein n=1 Tax=Bizionia myxarmorum TaxID=291186 RepID=A0A5D0RBP7_9FLAO|nr:hypothetical protein [Bizionia myxarmorum]TYB78306.1 hypothetical protein ES674_00570 [Bizionia myxarmorum]
MKHYFTLIAILFITLGFAQTTQEEYNYLTLGYADQLEKGLDMKQGYNLRFVSKSSIKFQGDSYREIEVYALHKTAGDFQGLLLKFYRSNNKSAMYFCVPTTNAGAELWNDFNSKIYNDFKEHKTFTFNTIINFSYIILQMYESNL